MSSAQEMPVEEAVKVIGGTQAGSAPVSEPPTASKALDAVPVGPDPAAAGSAGDDAPQDGDYFLDANLSDSMQVQLPFIRLGLMSQFWCRFACFCAACAYISMCAANKSMSKATSLPSLLARDK